MPFPSFLPAPNVQNVAISSTATIKFEPSGTYFGVRLYYERTTGTAATQAHIAADITGIRVILDGVVQRQYSATQLQMLNSFRHGIGMTIAAGEIPIYFSEPFRANEQAADSKSWGMNGVEDFTIEVDIAATAVTPVIKAYRIWTPFNTTMGEIVKIKPQVVQVAATGDLSMTSYPRNDRILGLHMNVATTVITAIKVKINEVEHINAPTPRLHDWITENYLVPQSGWTHLAFDARNRILECADPGILATAGDRAGRLPYLAYLPFEVVTTMAAATSFTTIRELLGPRD